MRIAVPLEGDLISQHFGRSPEFRFYDVEGGRIVKTETVPSPAAGHTALIGLLVERKADEVICGGIGTGAVNALFEAGIRFTAGAAESPDEAVASLLAGSLEHNSKAVHASCGGACGCH